MKTKQIPLNEQLMAARVASGQTRKELAKKLGKNGYSRQRMAALENGDIKITSKVAEQWAKACGVKFEEKAQIIFK